MEHDPAWQTLGVSHAGHGQHAIVNVQIFLPLAHNLRTDIDSLDAAREQIEATPTWPWTPGALRNFVLAVIFPMLLWGLQFLRSTFLVN